MKKVFSCIIFDSEVGDIGVLETRLGFLYRNIEIRERYSNTESALAGLRAFVPDIIFLDIHMPERRSAELLRLLPGIESEIIFVTAHSELALEAFKYAASGFVLKPIDDFELTRAINKAMERVNYRAMAGKSVFFPEAAAHKKIGVPNNNGIDYLRLDEIVYFETTNKYTRVVTDTRSIISSYNLGKFKTMLEGYSFYQVHRSFIVNIHKVERYEQSGGVIMSNKMSIPVARNLKDDFLNFFIHVTQSTQGYDSTSAKPGADIEA